MNKGIMVRHTANARGGLTTGAILSGAVAMLALPSAVLAFTVRFEAGEVTPSPEESVDVRSSAQDNAALSPGFPTRSLARGKLYPFTPASSASRPDRSVTVAVRVDPETARALSVRPSRLASGQNADWPEVRIAPTAFSLGVSRGYASFAQSPARRDERQSPAIPDMGRFSIAPGSAGGDSRFAPRIVIDETQAAGRAPRTFAGDSDELVDVGGSYRVTRNLNVTAGVRYSQERERLIPPTDGRQDSQAVYVGTQFRF
jgi:hypothetical protein